MARKNKKRNNSPIKVGKKPFQKSRIMISIKKILCQQLYQAKKLTVILATSILVTVKLEIVTLQYVFYICYFIYFKGQSQKVRGLINFKSKINAITLIYVAQLDFILRYTNVSA